jgi:photosystem II stability/assembly factor-like uncharacterized protein
MTSPSPDKPLEQVAVYALVASPAYAADGMCFAATTRGLLVSADHAVSFADAYGSLNLPEALPTPAVALSPGFASDGLLFAGLSGAILRSPDRGASWQYAELRTPSPIVTCTSVSPAFEEDGVLFAGTLDDGVFRSADRGSRWAAWNFGLIDLRVLCMCLSPGFGQDEALVVGTETGLFRSTNGGRAWRELGLPTELAPVLSVALSPDYGTDGVLFAGTESNGLWVSRDRGRGWELVEALGDGAVNALTTVRNGSSLALAAVVDEKLFVSRDGAKNWAEVALEPDLVPLCLCAPHGLARRAPLLVGCADGSVRQVEA